MLDQLKSIAAEYGLASAISVFALSLVVWLARISLKNPVEVVSGALADVDNARKALRAEVEYYRAEASDLRQRVASLEQLNAEQDRQIAKLRKGQRDAE